MTSPKPGVRDRKGTSGAQQINVVVNRSEELMKLVPVP